MPRLLTAALIFSLLASACTVPVTESSATPTPAAGAATETRPSATATPAASPTPEGRRAQLSEVIRAVEAQINANTDWRQANEGTTVFAGGGAKTGEEAHVRLDLSEGSLIRLGANTTFQLKELSPAEADPITRLKIDAGKVWVSITKALGAGSFEVETPSGLAGVRGSLMSTQYDPASGGVVVTCLEGSCRLTSTNGNSVDLQPGEQTEIAAAGQDPAPAHPIDPDQLADWAAQFPEAGGIIASTTPGPRVGPVVSPTLTAETGQIITGYWEETYGPTDVQGTCLGLAGGGGVDGGGASKPIAPIRQGEAGQFILVHNVNSRFDQESPGVYVNARTFDSQEFDSQLKPITITETLRDEYRVIGPTQLQRVNILSQQGGCTITFSETFDLWQANPHVLEGADSFSGFAPIRGEYTVKWQGADQCPAGLAQAVPAFTQISMTPAYDGSLVLYGSGVYDWIKPNESGAYELVEQTADGVQFRLTMEGGDPRNLYPYWTVFGQDASQNCSGTAQMALIPAGSTSSAPSAPTSP